HESSVLIATLNRSGLRPSFPARPICFSAFRLWSASLALPTAWPNMPSADFCIRGQDALRRPQFRSWNAEQTSRGKFSRLPCAVAGSTLRVLDEYGLRDWCINFEIRIRSCGMIELVGPGVNDGMA